MTLSIRELTGVAENLLADYRDRVPFETLCATLRACADEHPEASGPTLERLARLRLGRVHRRRWRRPGAKRVTGHGNDPLASSE